MNEYRDILYKIASLIAKDCIEQEQEDPFELRDGMAYVVKQAVNDHMMKNYHKIIFDSPMGKDSAKLLQDAGFHATWEGKAGNRGNTIWYIPKSQVPELSSADTMLQCVDILNKMDPNNRFQGLFDLYTSIELIED